MGFKEWFMGKEPQTAEDLVEELNEEDTQPARQGE